MSDFEDEILKRRMEDSDANSEVFESLRKHNQIFVNNLGAMNPRNPISKQNEVTFNRKLLNEEYKKKSVPELKITSVSKVHSDNLKTISSNVSKPNPCKYTDLTAFL